MNYRHEYHAGSFADVFKHVILSMFLEALQAKETAFTYLDTHAGRGLYDFTSPEAQKLKEFQSGIRLLIDYAKKTPAPHCFKKYLDLIASMNFDGVINAYPGSPMIAETFLREQDRMILCELHPEEFQFLKDNTDKRDRRIALHLADAYASMKAFLPPKSPRGFVHIDPPFEKITEINSILAALELSLKRWRMGQFMIWYPIKDKLTLNWFHQKVIELNTPHLFVDFFMQDTKISSNLMGCGVTLINPPWKLKEQLAEVALPYLASALNGRWNIGE